MQKRLPEYIHIVSDFKCSYNKNYLDYVAKYTYGYVTNLFHVLLSFFVVVREFVLCFFAEICCRTITHLVTF